MHEQNIFENERDLSWLSHCTEMRSRVLHVLFVCTGNICRSPTAERLALAYANRHHVRDLVVSSAGTRALVGHPIHAESARVLEKLGGDSSGFAARRLTALNIREADLVLAMTRLHRDAVLGLAPHKLHRTFTLVEAWRLVTECDADTIDHLASLRSQLAADDVIDVADPIGQTANVFAKVGAEIAELLPAVLELCRRSVG